MSAVIKNTDRALPCTLLNVFRHVEIESKGSTFPFHTYRMKPCPGGDFDVETREGGIRPWGRTRVPLVGKQQLCDGPLLMSDLDRSCQVWASRLSNENLTEGEEGPQRSERRLENDQENGTSSRI